MLHRFCERALVDQGAMKCTTKGTVFCAVVATVTVQTSRTTLHMAWWSVSAMVWTSNLHISQDVLLDWVCDAVLSVCLCQVATILNMEHMIHVDDMVMAFHVSNLSCHKYQHDHYPLFSLYLKFAKLKS